MAKKQGSIVDILFMLSDKIVLLITIGVLGWVVYDCFIKPKGVQDGGQVLSTSKAAADGGVLIDGYINQIKRPDNSTKPPEMVDVKDLFARKQTFKTDQIDRIPLRPIFLVDMELEEDRMAYTIPEIPRTSQAKIDHFHGRVYRPVIQELSLENDQVTNEVADVNVITVEAMIPFKELRAQFNRNFGRAQQPFEVTEPVFADVNLQRSQLNADGIWSDWQNVERISVDPIKTAMISFDIRKYSNKSYLNYLKIFQQPTLQKSILQPGMYDVVDLEEWLPPTKRLKKLKENKSGGGIKRRNVVDRKKVTDNKRKNFMGILGGNKKKKGGSLSLFLGGARKSNNQTKSNKESENVNSESWFNQENITLWAHDDSVKPGFVYRYRIQVGVFNPIAGHSWFNESQRHLKDQMVLWSEPIDVDQYVSVPESTLFFPKTVKQNEKTVDVEVYRWQDGQWHTKRFKQLGVGAVIGEIEVPKKKSSSSSTDPEPLPIDYRTNVTILDIIPNTQHWCKSGTNIRSVTTADLIVQDENGRVTRIGVDKQTWPESLQQRSKEVRRAYVDQRPQRRPG